VGVKPIRACLCLWSQRPSLLWCSPAGDALVRPVEDCTLGRVRSKARQLERLVAQAPDPRGLFPPQPRRFCRSQSGIAGCSRRAQRRTFPWTHRCAPTTPLDYPSPTPSPTTPREQRGTAAASCRGGIQPRVPALSPTYFRHRSHGKNSHQLPPPQPRQEQPRSTRCHNLLNHPKPGRR